MTMKSQADLERQLLDRMARVERGEISMDQASGTMDEWILQLGARKALLDPRLKQWLWYDRLHDAWTFAGCRVREAILIPFGRTAGIKKLPQPEAVDDWCVLRKGQSVHGPLHSQNLAKLIRQRGEVQGLVIWSTRANHWLRLGEVFETTVTLWNAANEVVLRLDDQGQFLPESPLTDTARKG